MTTLPLPAPPSMRGRRALVTGAASGIGRATALVLAQLGATVVAVDRAPLDETRDAVEAAGASCVVTRGDLAGDAFTASLFGTDPVHAVAHCAAILEGRPWHEDAA